MSEPGPSDKDEKILSLVRRGVELATTIEKADRENERLRAEVARLTRERDEARAESPCGHSARVSAPEVRDCLGNYLRGGTCELCDTQARVAELEAENARLRAERAAAVVEQVSFKDAQIESLRASNRALNERAQRAEARGAELEAALDRDKTGLASALARCRDEIEARAWVLEGRGPYEWDDDRYREESGLAFRAVVGIIDEALKASGQIAHAALAPKKPESDDTLMRKLRLGLPRISRDPDAPKEAAKKCATCGGSGEVPTNVAICPECESREFERAHGMLSCRKCSWWMDAEKSCPDCRKEGERG